MQKSNFLPFLCVLVLLTACTNENNTSTQDADAKTETDIDTEPVSEESRTENVNQVSKPKGTTEKKRKSYQLRIEDDNKGVFSGEFAYMADAAYFINCSTGNRYSVLMQDAFPVMEKAYLKMVGDAAGSKIYVVFEGEIKPKKKGDTSKMKGSITIKEVISLNNGISCNIVVRRMGGMYSYMADAGIFTNCKTKRQYAVQTTGANVALESQYAKVSQGNGEKVYVEFEAYVQRTEGMEGGTSVDGVFVTRVIGFDKSYSCE